MTARAGERSWSDETSLTAAITAGDEAAFGVLAERYRRQLQVHCYRMLGSFEDAEDIVQETLIRAWRKRETFEGRSLFRTWLYQIATNACLDALRRRPRRILPPELGPASDPRADLPEASDLPWLQPYPDLLLESTGPEEAPDAMTIEKEAIELAFLVAIQALPPRQRAVLIARDVLDWSAAETATLLGASVASVNSALQRAHETMRHRLPPKREAWTPTADATSDERILLRRYMDAHEQADTGVLATLLRDDVRLSMPPMAVWYEGLTAVIAFHEGVFAPDVGPIRGLATAANRQPVAALYVRPPGETAYRPLALDMLRVEAGAIVEITSFVSPQLFAAFGLPPSLP